MLLKELCRMDMDWVDTCEELQKKNLTDEDYKSIVQYMLNKQHLMMCYDDSEIEEIYVKGENVFSYENKVELYYNSNDDEYVLYLIVE